MSDGISLYAVVGCATNQRDRSTVRRLRMATEDTTMAAGRTSASELRAQYAYCGPTALTFIYVTLLLVSCLLMLFVPYMIIGVHRSRVTETQMRQDGAVLMGLPSFRDVLWEMWTPFNTHLKDDPTGYVIWTAVLYILNLVLWWLWYPKRMLRDQHWHLSIKLLLLTGASLLSNSLNWFPFPQNALQHEPLGLALFGAFVVRNANRVLAPRVAWTLLLVSDVFQESRPWFKDIRLPVLILYTAAVVLYLWATRQMFSIALFNSVLLALAVDNFGDGLCTRFELMFRRRAKRERDTAARDTETSGTQMFTVDYASGDDDDGDDVLLDTNSIRTALNEAAATEPEDSV